MKLGDYIKSREATQKAENPEFLRNAQTNWQATRQEHLLIDEMKQKKEGKS